MRHFIACFLLLSIAATTNAAEFLVSSRLDSGAGTFREALISAITTPSPPHVIRFTAAYPLGGRINLASALPTIQVELTIEGNNRFPQLSGVEQFPLLITTRSLTLRDIQLMDGWAPVVNTTAGDGGCVRYNGAPTAVATLLVERTNFLNCRARELFLAGGGAIHWPAPAGGLEIRQSTFTNNRAISNDAANEQPRGGAVQASTSAIVITGSTFVDNQVQTVGTRGGLGGALALFVQPGDFNFASLQGNRFSGNQVTENASDQGRGGAVFVALQTGTQVAIDQNWFNGNSAREGGALFLRGTNVLNLMNVRNNSFHNGQAQFAGGGMSVLSGFLVATHNTWNESLAPSASTLAFTNTDVRRFANNVLVRPFGSAHCTMTNIVRNSLQGAGNFFDSACSGLEQASDQFFPGDLVLVVDETERVGVLKLPPGTSAIDGGSDVSDDCSATDARGTTRPQDGDGNGQARCDAGAYEVASPVLFRDGFE
ncbi:MAG: hypothetical protein IPK97_10105 [Ahniella sp.]|nr:hypothetical protein [Ahniella sp.]